jgi:hypothetical protein
MNQEFTKIKSENVTRYILENGSGGATSGGTSSASVGGGSYAMPIGGIQRRKPGQNLISQEAKEKEAPKPRNFVAKNAKMGGAGQHRDKKKEIKQGVEKHKKPYAEDVTASSISSPHGPAAVAGAQRGGFAGMWSAQGDSHDKKTLAAYQIKIMNKQTELEIAKKLGGIPPTFGKDGTGIFSGMDVRDFPTWLDAHPQYVDAILGITGTNNKAPAAAIPPSQQVAQNQQSQKVNVPPVPTAGQTTMSDYKSTLEGHDDNGGEEYNDEVGMADSNIHTIIRSAKELINALEPMENMPEWAQDKLAQVKGMLVSVKDYVESQHEQGNIYHTNEGLGDEFSQFLKDKGIKHRVAGSPEQERQRTQDMMAQRAKDRANAPAPAAPSPEAIAQAKEKLAMLSKQFDPNYQYSDDHSFWTKQHQLAQQIDSLKKFISRGEVGVAEGSKWRNHPDAHEPDDSDQLDRPLAIQPKGGYPNDELKGRPYSWAEKGKVTPDAAARKKASIKSSLGKHHKANLPEQGLAKEELNELDMFAPVTTFIKMTDGSYVQADWRRGQFNAGLEDSASFINFKPVNPTVAKQLGLDSHQRTNAVRSMSDYRNGTIAHGGDYQRSGPLATRGYEVVDYNKPESMEELPPEVKPALIKWVQKQGQGVAEGSAHGYNVAKWYEKNNDQLKLTRWLRKEAGLEKNAPVYFDDADLVYGDNTIVPGALVNPKLKFNDLLTALTRATGGQGKQNVDGVYREQGVAEGVDIGQEWMSDTELDQYVPQQLQQQWRELLGYDRNGNPSALWANLTGGYEPDVNDPQDRARMVKVANKWFAVNKIPNVKFFNVKDADDELEWLVQIGSEQGVAEGDGDEAYVACIVQFNRSGRAMVQRTKPISHERAEEVIRNALAKNTFVHPPFMTIYPASAGKLDGSTIMAQFPDMSQKGLAEADNKKEWQKQNAKPKQLGKTEKYFSTRHTTKDTGAADKEKGVAEAVANPFALARSMKNKGYKSHKPNVGEDAYIESLFAQLEERAKK